MLKTEDAEVEEIGKRYIATLWGKRRRDFARSYWRWLELQTTTAPPRAVFGARRIELRLDDIYYCRFGMMQTFVRVNYLIAIKLLAVWMMLDELFGRLVRGEVDGGLPIGGRAHDARAT
jgi:hypothetical protein